MGPLFRKYPLSRVLPALAVATVAFALAPLEDASAAVRYTFQRLHSFSCIYCNVSTGVVVSGLLRDSSGNLYGTAEFGGTNECGNQFGSFGCGMVFELIPNSDFTRYSGHLIHNFGSSGDGALPTGELVMDVDGNLYGTAFYGANSAGLIYKLTKGSTHWTETILHEFCSCGDGTYPDGGLAYQGEESGALWDGKEPLFGVTDAGGVGQGNVFEATPGSTWSVQNIHSFKESGYPNPVVVDASGNVYGTNQQGGTYGEGLMYRLAAGTWKEATLKNFCAETNCTDGSLPVGKLVVDASGNLFGATSQGGSNNVNYNGGGGVAFERPAGGSYQVLYNFCSVVVGSFCTDGQYPGAGLLVDGSGNLFGITSEGGKANEGLVFELDPRGAETVIHSFNRTLNGYLPGAPLVLDSQGDLFGTTDGGGTNDAGIAFVLKP